MIGQNTLGIDPPHILDISFRCPYHEKQSMYQFHHNHGQELHNFEFFNSGFSNLNWFIDIKKLALRSTSIGENWPTRPQAVRVGFGGSSQI